LTGCKNVSGTHFEKLVSTNTAESKLFLFLLHTVIVALISFPGCLILSEDIVKSVQRLGTYFVPLVTVLFNVDTVYQITWGRGVIIGGHNASFPICAGRIS